MSVVRAEKVVSREPKAEHRLEATRFGESPRCAPGDEGVVSADRARMGPTKHATMDADSVMRVSCRPRRTFGHIFHPGLRLVSFVGLALAVGCGDSMMSMMTSGTEADSSSGEGSSNDGTSTSASSGGGSKSGTSFTTGATTGNATSGDTEGSSDTVATIDPQPLGSSCQQDAECETGKCRIFGMTDGVFEGLCSHCITDLGCRVDGLGLNCVQASDGEHYVCSNGGLGESCDDEDSCQDGTHCAEVSRNVGRCSACSRNNHCGDDDETQICGGLHFEIGAGGRAVAYRVCAGVGTLPQNSACPLGDTGSEACSVAHCVGVNAGSDNLRIGVCGQCRPGEEEDCSGGAECMPPTASGANLQGSTCPGGDGSESESGDAEDDSDTSEEDSTDAETGDTDAGETDAGETDSGETDAGTTEGTETTDAGETDAGESDAGETDASETDTEDADATD